MRNYYSVQLSILHSRPTVDLITSCSSQTSLDNNFISSPVHLSVIIEKPTSVVRLPCVYRVLSSIASAISFGSQREREIYIYLHNFETCNLLSIEHLSGQWTWFVGAVNLSFCRVNMRYHYFPLFSATKLHRHMGTCYSLIMKLQQQQSTLCIEWSLLYHAWTKPQFSLVFCSPAKTN
jgi:hypothetical protein